MEKKNIQHPHHHDRRNDKPAPKPEEAVEQPVKNAEPVDDDNIATADDIAAYAREAAEKRARKNKTPQFDAEDAERTSIDGTDEMGNMIDPYLEPDPSIPQVPFKESIFLSRGCSQCPKSYVPVAEQELRSCAKVGSSNWMKGIRKPCEEPFDIVEVRFKNNRKDFFRLPDGIDVNEGDVVAVEGMPGHDVGIVSLMGEACRLQMRRKKVSPDSENLKKLFRRAKSTDIERWVESLRDEKTALLKTRRIVEEQGLSMKVNDVEYQGDHAKAIFYYTADDRVDFRTLIKVLADEFKVRIEMKQIGVRQEAGKVGGIGTCGRELCCSTWLTNFKSVTTGVAKAQQILPNPQKLAGQCGKLKCCLNFEYEVYVDALKQFPPANQAIRFQKGLALYKKTDVFRGIMWYAYEGENDLYAIPAESVKKIIAMNKEQQYPEKLEDFQVELMASAALATETNSSEFEQGLRRMADSGNEVTGEEEKPRGSRDDRRDDHRDRRNNRGPKENRENRENREREPRENRENRENRDNRDNNRSRNNRQRPRGERQNGERQSHNNGGNNENRQQ